MVAISPSKSVSGIIEPLLLGWFILSVICVKLSHVYLLFCLFIKDRFSMLFLRLSSIEDLRRDSLVTDQYSNYLWVGPADQMPINRCVTAIGIPKSGDALRISVGIGNPIPLFYGWDSLGRMVLSDSCGMAWAGINGAETVDATQLDNVGLMEAMLFDGPLVNRTLLKDVKKLQMGEVINIDLVTRQTESSWHWLPSIQSHTISEGAALEAAIEHIIGLSKAFSRKKIGLLPLTGGLDSRLLAGLARNESTLDLCSYTFQRGASLETWSAKKVARNLSVSHQVVDLPAKACYQDFAREVAEKTQGMISGMHCHGIYSCQKGISAELQAMPRIFGYFGDPITGAMTATESGSLSLDNPEKVLRKYEFGLFPELVDRYRPEILEDLGVAYKAFEVSGSKKGTFHEFWKIQQRQNNLITHLFAYHRSEHGVEVLLPFLDAEFIEFFLSLPYELRKDRVLFKKACKAIYPDLFELPGMHFKPGTFLSIVESVFEKLESAFNRLNPGQELLLSPFKYEQHEKNLYNYLRDDVQKGIDILCKMENIKRRTIKFPVWKYSTPKEYYRLATLHYLLEQPDAGSGYLQG
jgi:hypothetical protein